MNDKLQVLTKLYSSTCCAQRPQQISVLSSLITAKTIQQFWQVTNTDRFDKCKPQNQFHTDTL